MVPGKFITLEGGEGAGKSTQIKNLAQFLRSKGLEVVETREVGGCPSAEEIRALWLDKGEGHWDALTELLLIFAARREHLTRTIWPALERGAWVVSDRFVDSTRAYQGIGMELGLDFVDHLYECIANDFEPDLTLLLDLPVETGLSRMASRGGQDDRYQQKDQSFHTKLREAYLVIAKNDAGRVHIVNAAASAENVSDQIITIVKTKFDLPA